MIGMMEPDLSRRRRFTPAVIAAAVFAACICAAAAVGAVATGNSEFIFYLVVMIVLIGCVLVIHARLNLPAALIWALTSWGALHMAGGLVPVPASWPIDGEIRVLYSWWILPREGGGGWLKYDHITHAYGFGITTWLCWVCVARIMQRRYGEAPRPSVGLITLSFAAGCGFGAMNEIVEFTATRFADTNVGGYENTGWDLVANATGAAIAALVILITGRRASDG
jgi:hypothetical protein